jgi:prephenate dehydrogenase
MEGVIREALPALGTKTLVTDVGSVKGTVVRVLGPLLEGKALFVGSHPMAGSEKTGLDAARADLFQGSVCIVTPEPATSPEAVTKASLFWEKLGCRVRQLDPVVHDQVCARISHVPHVAAAALVNAVAQRCPEAFGFSGPGFRDTTRVAGGAPSMWTEILLSNREAVSQGLRALVDQLEEVIALLEQNEGSVSAPLDAFLSAAKQRRDQLRLR